MLGRLLNRMTESSRPRSAVDLGCGQLRHLDVFLETFKRIVLVDTPRQLARELRFDGRMCTIPDYVAALPRATQRRINIVDSERFVTARIAADAVLTVNTFDVVPGKVRGEMCLAALRNLLPGGLFGVIAPRNDTTITSRCTVENQFLDGHVFEHHGVMTFFRNFRHHRPLISRIEQMGGRLVDDMSVYRHVCLLFERI